MTLLDPPRVLLRKARAILERPTPRDLAFGYDRPEDFKRSWGSRIAEDAAQREAVDRLVKSWADAACAAIGARAWFFAQRLPGRAPLRAPSLPAEEVGTLVRALLREARRLAPKAFNQGPRNPWRASEVRIRIDAHPAAEFTAAGTAWGLDARIVEAWRGRHAAWLGGVRILRLTAEIEPDPSAHDRLLQDKAFQDLMGQPESPDGPTRSGAEEPEAGARTARNPPRRRNQERP